MFNSKMSCVDGLDSKLPNCSKTAEKEMEIKNTMEPPTKKREVFITNGYPAMLTLLYVLLNCDNIEVSSIISACLIVQHVSRTVERIRWSICAIQDESDPAKQYSAIFFTA